MMPIDADVEKLKRSIEDLSRILGDALDDKSLLWERVERLEQYIRSNDRSGKIGPR
jgi:hypothetical protein